MMEIVPTAAAFDEHLRRAKTILSRTSAFPKCIFSVPPASWAFFESGDLTSRELFEFLLHLCEMTDDPGFVFMMVDPDPINYFQKHFGWLPAARFSPGDRVEDFPEFVTKDPGGSLADAIAYRKRRDCHRRGFVVVRGLWPS
jgi:hypothetical protein